MSNQQRLHSVPEAEGRIAPAHQGASRPATRRRYRYRRRHTPHFYLVCSGLSCAALVCVLNSVAFATRSVLLGQIAFCSVLLAALVISCAFFWGFYMLMDGNIPAHRIRVLAPHAAVGFLSPLFYTLNIAAGLEGLGSAPVSGVSVACSYVCLALLAVQFTMGRAVVRPEPLRVLRKIDTGRE